MLLLLFESSISRKVLTMFMFNVTEGMYFFWIKISLACLVFANILSDTSLFVFIFMLSLASSFVDTLLSVWTRLVRHSLLFNTLRLRQNGHHFPDDIFNCIFLNENVWISTKISLKFVPKGPINNMQIDMPTFVVIIGLENNCSMPSLNQCWFVVINPTLLWINGNKKLRHTFFIYFLFSFKKMHC